MQSVIHASQRIVVKVGSSLVTNDGKGLDHAALSRWASEIADLTRRGKQVVLVSSGAIAAGPALKLLTRAMAASFRGRIVCRSVHRHRSASRIHAGEVPHERGTRGHGPRKKPGLAGIFRHLARSIDCHCHFRRRCPCPSATL